VQSSIDILALLSTSEKPANPSFEPKQPTKSQVPTTGGAVGCEPWLLLWVADEPPEETPADVEVAIVLDGDTGPVGLAPVFEGPLEALLDVELAETDAGPVVVAGAVGFIVLQKKC
jgi:hypothetical protein